MYPGVLFVVLRVDEGGVADLALERPLARVGGLDVVVQQAPALEALGAVLALVALVVQVRGTRVRVQVGALREARPAATAHERPLACSADEGKSLKYSQHSWLK